MKRIVGFSGSGQGLLEPGLPLGAEHALAFAGGGRIEPD